MKIVVDMNLSPFWVNHLQANGFSALHWSTVGAITAPDEEIMAWAKENGCIIFTNDLDFSRMLAFSGDHAPSVLQIRTASTLPRMAGDLTINVLRQFEMDLTTGALVSFNERRAKVRALPLQ